MVYKLDHITFALQADNGEEPVKNISLGFLWVSFTPDIYKKKQDQVRSIYTGNDDQAFDPSRPCNIPFVRLTTDGILQARPSVEGSYKLGVHDDYARHLIVTWAAQTGDIPHVAAALALDPLMDVAIIYDPTMESQANMAYDTYLNAVVSGKVGSERDYEKLGVGEGRLRMIKKPETRPIYDGLCPIDVTGMYHIGEIGISRWRILGKDVRELFKETTLWAYKNRYGARLEYPTVSVVGATQLIANVYKEYKASWKTREFYEFMGGALSARLLAQTEIDAWVSKKFGKKKTTKLLLLWSRYSGQNPPGGYNPAGDSDPIGQQQIIDFSRKLDFTVITVGHDCTWSEIPNPHGDIHFGEFWTEDPFDGYGRPGQTSLYCNLINNYNIVQIGQKTGGMDNAALVGVPTVYIEDVQSRSLARMQKWKEMRRYKGAIVSQPPTVLEQELKAMWTDVYKPRW
ncbi:hypothetical protein EW026_g6372 [Hermanssonia centrifuga]|uniref:Uncharacterized protein n=1 Tax=Hermanssonia centrifuga TaxID=98765 RepID=A0A4S4KB90_9APHY|nr:hypothetical protein EW026_g6372 [Hermanssonia centrifuga]